MDHIDQSLFLLLNAQAQPNAFLLWVGKFFANYVILLIPLSVLAGWLWGTERSRKLMLQATASGLIGLLIAQIIGLVYFHPRPFAVGLGQLLIPHAANASFPSDHLTLFWAVSFSFLAHPQTRRLGAVLALSGLPVAWARIFVGVHFPLDMVGAAAVSVISAWLALRGAGLYLAPFYRLAITLHRKLLSPLIKRGWVGP